MIGKKHIQEWKLTEVNNLVDLFNNYKNVAVIDVARLSDKQVQEIRKVLRGVAIIRMSKKNLQLLAIEHFKENSKKQNLDELAKNIPGQAVLCFTNIDIYDLKKIFNENEWMVPAKPNEVTPIDIWVPAGDTGLPTGQVISELNMILKLPTRIQNDTIWIREDTRTHKAGDIVEVKQAAVLKKLGVNPILSLIKIKYAWCDGELLTEDVLYLDIEQFKQYILSAYIPAQKLAVKMGIIDKETFKPLIMEAHRGALSILMEMPIFIEEMQDEYIKKAVINANLLNSVIFGEVTITESKTSKEKAKKEEKPEEEVGIGSLFG